MVSAVFVDVKAVFGGLVAGRGTSQYDDAIASIKPWARAGIQ
jgi:hypothetical protein